MHVGAVSQHVLRMSFVPEDEAKRFDTEVVGFWSQLIHPLPDPNDSQTWWPGYWLS